MSLRVRLKLLGSVETPQQLPLVARQLLTHPLTTLCNGPNTSNQGVGCRAVAMMGMVETTLGMSGSTLQWYGSCCTLLAAAQLQCISAALHGCNEARVLHHQAPLCGSCCHGTPSVGPVAVTPPSPK